MSRFLLFILSCALLFTVAAPSHAQLKVTQSGGAATHDGSSWINALSADDLATMLQSGPLQDTIGGEEEFWLSTGVYSNLYLRPRTVLLGGFAGNETRKEQRDPEKNQTTLNSVVFEPIIVRGDGGLDNYHYPDASTMIDGCEIVPSFQPAVFSVGLTVGGRTHPIVQNCRIFGNSLPAVEVSDSYLELDNCTILSSRTAGVSIDGTSTAAELNHCQIDHNQEAGVWVGEGASATISDCNINDNGLAAWSRPAARGLGGITVNQGGIQPGQLNPAGVVIQRCILTHNFSDSGGGLRVFMPAKSEVGVRVVDCQITHNGEAPTDFEPQTPPESGGGVSCSADDPLRPEIVSFLRCQITDNVASKYGGGMAFVGPGVAVRSCVVARNSVVNPSPATIDLGGGGIYVEGPYASISQYRPAIRDCLLEQNLADGMSGGAIQVVYANPNIINCTIVNNRAKRGGGIFNYANRDAQLEPNLQTAGLIANCALFGNVADVGDGFCHYTGPVRPYAIAPTLSHCAKLRGGGDTWVVLAGDDSTEDFFPDSNLFLDDPGFVGGGDHHPTSASGLLNQGDTQLVEQGEVDLDGGPRVLDSVVDIGAYEKQAASALIVLSRSQLTVGAYDKRRKLYPITVRMELLNMGPSDAHNFQVKALTVFSDSGLKYTVSSLKVTLPAPGTTLSTTKTAVVTCILTPSGPTTGNVCLTHFTIGGTYDAPGGPAPFTIMRDLTAPLAVKINFSLTPKTLTPANGRMVAVRLSYSVTVNGDCSPDRNQAISVTSIDSGVTHDDMVLDGPNLIHLRATSSDPKHPRVYAVTVTVKDGDTVLASKTLNVTVAKAKATH